MSVRAHTAVCILALALLGGCANAPPVNNVDTAALNSYLKYAGSPIDSFTYLGHYNGFRTLGGRDVVVWTSINDAYLITVFPPCERLQYANDLRLTSADRLVTRGYDWVRFNDGRCRIQTIRPINYKAMKAAGLGPP